MHLGAVYLDQKRLTTDQNTRDGQTLRLHLQPKRYPKALIDWSTTLLHTDKDFLVFNKPQGVPAHSTLDNQIENALFQLSQLTGEKLYPAHRLDVGTSGVCLLARTPQFQKQFHQILKNSKTQKIYEALTTRAPALGRYRHYMQVQKRAPQLIFEEPPEGAKLCELEILSVEEENEAFRVRIRTFTGRTHQIRAQLGFLACPLKGDQLYGALEAHEFFLHAYELKFDHAGKSFSFSQQPDW